MNSKTSSVLFLLNHNWISQCVIAVVQFLVNIYVVHQQVSPKERLIVIGIVSKQK